ncbi:MAG: hypothetical protein AAF639_35270 [Chloroflexota bacterium]
MDATVQILQRGLMTISTELRRKYNLKQSDTLDAITVAKLGTFIQEIRQLLTGLST